MKNEYYFENDKVKIILHSRKFNDMICSIDKIDLDKLLKWDITWHIKYSKNANLYYPVTSDYSEIDGKRNTYYLSRYLLNAQKGEFVDHKDHDPMNNCRDNLRITTGANNSKHRKSKNSNNTSGERNVSIVNGKPIVQLQVDGENQVWRGFSSVKEAGVFAELMRKKYYKDYCGESM